MEGKIKSHRANIAKFVEFCEEISKSPEIKTSKEFLDGKSKMIDCMWSRIQNANDEINEGITSELEVTVGPNFEVNRGLMEKEFNRAFVMLDKVTILICKAVESLSKPADIKIQPLQLSENLVLQTTEQSGIKLKPINIPTFSGDYTKWISFKNMFESLISNNEKFTDLQKMHYLGSCLGGDAERLISQFDVTEASFKPAYELIKDRYNNEVILIESHVIKILAQPDLNSESSKGLKEMMDVTTENLRALKSLGIDIDSWDPILLLLLVQKLDAATRRLWEQNLKPKTRPTMKEFLEFLAGRYHALGCQQTFKFTMESLSSMTQQSSTSFPPRNHQSFHASLRRACPICSEDSHSIFSCENFRASDPRTRTEMVKRAKLCQRCLKNHQSQCYQREGCRVCRDDHHTFLHIDRHERPSSTKDQQNNRDGNQFPRNPENSTVLQSNHISLQRSVSSKIINLHHSINNVSKNDIKATPWDAKILLATAIVLIRPVKGNIFYPFRCLLDQGSDASHISEATARKLGLQKTKIAASMCGLGGVTVGSSDSVVEFEIGSKHNQSFIMNVQAVVVTKVTNPVPSTFIDRSNWKHIDGLQLADPEFHKPSEIEVILGASVYGYLLLPGLKKAATNCPVAQNTELGWILSGATQTDSISSSSADSHLETINKLSSQPTEHFTQ